MKRATTRKFFFTSLIPDEYIDAAADGKLVANNCTYNVSEGFVYELFIRIHLVKCKVSSCSLERRKVALQRLLYAFSGVQFDRDKLWSRSLRMKKKLTTGTGASRGDPLRLRWVRKVTRKLTDVTDRTDFTDRTDHFGSVG